MKVLRNGELIEEEDFVPEVKEHKTNEPLDRSKIDNSTKQELVILLNKLPEIKPILDILLGKKEVEKLRAK